MRIFIIDKYDGLNFFYLKEGFCRDEIDESTFEYMYNHYLKIFDSFSPNHYQLDSDTLILL